jgi:hypothetical protein
MTILIYNATSVFILESLELVIQVVHDFVCSGSMGM